MFEQDAYTDRAFHAHAEGLDPRDRALATTLAYGTVQRRDTLDHVAAQLSSRPLAKLDSPVLAAVRLGLYQLLFLDGIPEHAAVNDSVELAKRASHGGAGLVNAVLRRAAREGQALLAGLDDVVPEQAAVLHSIPEWMARQWWEELGGDAARALLRRINEPAESALRVNTLVAGVQEVLGELPVAAARAQRIPEGLVLAEPFDAHGSGLFERGAVMPQSRASMLVARVVAPAPGARVLDLCAAPGAKTTHLAALMGDEGEITAVERHPGRAKALAESCARTHAGCVSVHVADAVQWVAEAFSGRSGAVPGRGADAVSGRRDAVPAYDYVLVDPPCSGLGTLQSRPDRRWRVTPEAVQELAGVQRALLAAGAEATAPGGVLVYSVCTISRAESERVVEAFLAARSDFHAIDLQTEYRDWPTLEPSPYLQLLPHRDRTDGFFIAALKRG